MDAATLKRLQSAMARRGYREAKEDAEKSIAEWKWATGEFFGIVPLACEMLGRPRGKLLASPPRQAKNTYVFGFDADARLRIIRRHGDKAPEMEVFIGYSGKVAIQQAFLWKERARFDEVALESRGPISLHSVGRGGTWTTERYSYAGGRLVRLEVEHFQPGMTEPATQRCEVAYDASGVGRGSLVERGGKRRLLFTLKSSSTPRREMDTTLSQFELELERRIRAQTKKLAGTFYCLVLNYSDDPTNGCIPFVALGKVPAGDRPPRVPGLKVRPGNADETRWNPAEFSVSIRPKSPKLHNLDERLRMMAREGAKIDIRASCNRVAERLNGSAWNSTKATPAFLVYAVDDDLAHLAANLALAKRTVALRDKAKSRSRATLCRT